MRSRLSSLGGEDREAMSRSITERVLTSPEYLGAHSIFVYASMREEPDTASLIRFALSDGKSVYLPRIDGDRMDLVPYDATTPTTINRYGIEEPQGAPTSAMPDLAVIPLLAFDRDKHRLGRGKGYYDRFLAGYSGHSIALAFSVQEVDRVPTEDYDLSPQVIFTDKERIG